MLSESDEHCGGRVIRCVCLEGSRLSTWWLGKEGLSKEMKSELVPRDNEPLQSRSGGRAFQAGGAAR